MTSQGLSLVSLREPTRETATSSTCIDSIYSNVTVRNSKIEKTTFSDHYSLKIDIDIHYEVVNDIFEYRSLKRLTDPLYCEKFLFVLNHSLSKIKENSTPAESYLTKIAQTIRDTSDKYFPLKSFKKTRPEKTWITNRIKRHISVRDKLYQTWIKTKSDEAHEKYRRKRNEVNMEIKMAKRKHVQQKDK